jgi:hypothetical protein
MRDFALIFCMVILKTILKTITSFPSLTISRLFPTHHQHGYEKTNEHVPIKVHDIHINSKLNLTLTQIMMNY